jgi:hypothetical protein
MTEDDFRRIIREEFDRVARQHEADARTPWEPPRDGTTEALLAWVRFAPLGTTGTAKELLPAFLATDPAHAEWTPISFGMGLSKIRDRIVSGRFLLRTRDRKGRSIFTVEVFPLAAPGRSAPLCGMA